MIPINWILLLFQTSNYFPVVHFLNRSSEASHANSFGTPGPPFLRFGSSSIRCRCWIVALSPEMFPPLSKRKTCVSEAPAITTEDGEYLEQFPPHFSAMDESPVGQQIFRLGPGRVRMALGHVQKLHLWLLPSVQKKNYVKCCFTCRKKSQIVVGDNCCGCSMAGLQVTSGIKYEDLVHRDYVHGRCAHRRRCNFSAMDDPGCPPGILCHGGMLNAAREVKKKKMESKHILDNAFLEHPDYELVITGHSLGGSVAAIIAMLYKEKYPNVRCYSFAPSPIFNASALKYTYENIFTVIYGNDAVCYLNYENIKQLVVEMVQGLKECNLPKYKIFMRPDRPLPNNTENNYQASETTQRNYGTSMPNEGANGTVSVNMNEAEPDVTNFSTENFYVAGRILHIRRTKQGYRLKLSSAFNYKPLLLRPKYIKDHFPQFTQKHSGIWAPLQ
ncbi:diacylglycerol lipase-beta [Caerostris extrusa]|uniref:sn-1-specific diacylglycerol lipase n=1 Tax=Caerostris extrusa TaxID=172846 RepID=A0AAV4M8C0_CAEEX|nr:diacylglycerol lipase-beta [Caerostris extrusa]